MSLVYVCFAPHPPIIVAEVGKGEEKVCQATIESYNKIANNIIELGVESLLIISPHAPLTRQGIVYLDGNSVKGDFSKFGAGDVKVEFEVDRDLLVSLKESIEDLRPVLTELDHASLVPLYFLSKAGWKGKIVVLGMPLHHAEDYGRSVGEVLSDRENKYAILASGDLSHRLKEDGPYGFHPAGPKFDNIIIKGIQKDTTIIRGIPEEILEEAGQCGYYSLLFALGAREGAPKVLSYEAPFGIGYLAAETYRSTPIAGYARECLEYYLTAQPFDRLHIPGDPLLKEKKGCFVTLKKDGELRGCIGTVHPTRENLASEIRHNAIAAGTQDPRFWPVQASEMKLIKISVDVLSEPEKIQSTNELDPQLYGVIVRNRGKVGLLLPHLEGIDTVEEQVNIARQKAGIWPEEEIELWRFKVERYFE